jgi:hypothetical protein
MDSKLSSSAEAWSPPIAGFIQNDSQFHRTRLLNVFPFVITGLLTAFDLL